MYLVKALLDNDLKSWDKKNNFLAMLDDIS